jgi:hypothetical protein
MVVVCACEGVPQGLAAIDNAGIIVKVSHQHSAFGQGHRVDWQ